MTEIAGQTRLIAVSEGSQAGEARRSAATLAAANGFGEDTASNLAIVVTELATNLIKHTRGGEILLTAIENNTSEAIDVVALDRGPGMRNVNLCLRDGFSTSGTPGGGLGAVSRISDEFDIHSEPERGTAIFSRIYRDGRPKAGLRYSAVRLPITGEIECGDAWSVASTNGQVKFLVADGLGHGPLAASASRAAVRSFSDNSEEAPADAIQRIHLALRSTRGAAASLASVDVESGDVLFCGVGNTCAVLTGAGRPQHMISHNGTLGHYANRFQEFSYRWNDGTVLVMHSDGLSASWDMARYPDLRHRHPGIIAAVLYRDFHRTRDDVTVLAARIENSHG